MPALTEWGPQLNPALQQEPKNMKKVGRSEEPCHPKTGFDCSQEYADCEVEDWHDGSFKRHTWGPNVKKQAHHEEWLGNGNGVVHSGDMCRTRCVGGTDTVTGKNGANRTYNSNMDSAAYGGMRENWGTDTKAQGTTHLASRGPGGGHSVHTNGNVDMLASGVETRATLTASGSTRHNIGKWTCNAEGGIGFGVNQGSNMRCYMRMEPDGTFHIQVTPQGKEGGNAVVKITPDGAVLVTSESTITVESKGTHTIKAPLLYVDAPIKTTSTIESDGDHTAPNFHGCADFAKSKC